MKWLLMLMFIFIGCAHEKKQSPQSKEAAIGLEGSHYTALEFAAGSAELSNHSKGQLNALAQKALRDGREIDDIKILSWADKEYPTPSQKEEPADINLAQERNKNIKSYIRNELHAESQIDDYNMAKRPSSKNQTFSEDEYTVKEAIEKSGATGTKKADGSVSYTKASKALVILEYNQPTQTQ